MEFRNIQYFIKLTESSSISQAARELYISQHPLSKAIQKLEEELLESVTSHTSPQSQDAQH